MFLKIYRYLVVVCVVTVFSYAMDERALDHDQLSTTQSVQRQRVVTFAIPVDDRPCDLSKVDDLLEVDPPHKPMKFFPKKERKRCVENSLSFDQVETYWQSFLCSLCRLAYAEFDENNFYRSLRD